MKKGLLLAVCAALLVIAPAQAASRPFTSAEAKRAIHRTELESEVVIRKCWRTAPQRIICQVEISLGDLEDETGEIVIPIRIESWVATGPKGAAWAFYRDEL